MLRAIEQTHTHTQAHDETRTKHLCIETTSHLSAFSSSTVSSMSTECCFTEGSRCCALTVYCWWLAGCAVLTMCVRGNIGVRCTRWNDPRGFDSVGNLLLMSSKCPTWLHTTARQTRISIIHMHTNTSILSIWYVFSIQFGHISSFFSMNHKYTFFFFLIYAVVCANVQRLIEIFPVFSWFFLVSLLLTDYLKSPNDRLWAK